MNEIVLTVAFKGMGMLLVIGGGVAALRYGFHVFRDGAGSGAGEIALDLGHAKIKARSAGSVIMATACLWAWAGVLLSPNLDQKVGETRVYSFVTPSGELNMQVVAAKIPRDRTKIPVDPESLKNFLGQAVKNADEKRPKGLAQINGQPASIDLSSVDVIRNPTGEYRLLAKVQSPKEAAVVFLEPKIESGKITFLPAGADKFDKREQ